jgi:hypothetical protein
MGLLPAISYEVTMEHPSRADGSRGLLTSHEVTQR